MKFKVDDAIQRRKRKLEIEQHEKKEKTLSFKRI